MLGTSAHVGWTNLPLRPIFLPLLARLTFELAGSRADAAPTWPAAPRAQLEETPPVSVETIPPPATQTAAADAAATPAKGPGVPLRRHARDRHLHAAAARSGPAHQIAYSVNFDPDEADPTKIEPRGAEEGASPTPLLFRRRPRRPFQHVQAAPRGQEPVGTAARRVLIVLVFETFLSNRLSGRA